MSTRRVRFVALARERQRMEAADELERSRQVTASPAETQEQQDARETAEKRVERERMDRAVRMRLRIVKLKRMLVEYPEMKYACYCISIGLAFLFMQWLLVNGRQPWDEEYEGSP